MMLKQSLKSPEKGDELHQYTIKLSLIYQSIGFPQTSHLLSLLQLFITENSIWLSATFTNYLARRAISLSEPVPMEEGYASEPPGLPTQEGGGLGPA